ncbi:MAG: adenylyltransferase/cytidyltransferase family protein [Candidatus Acidiferrales bacterium]
MVSQSDLILQRCDWKRNGLRVVFASGSFDLLHPGHIRLLEQARSLGDALVVAVKSDAIVRAEHGKMRPIARAGERAEILSALAAVDYVVVLDGATASEVIAGLAPEIIVKAGGPGSIERAFDDDEALTSAGTQVVRIPIEPGYSTDGLIQRIRQLPA